MKKVNIFKNNKKIKAYKKYYGFKSLGIISLILIIMISILIKPVKIQAQAIQTKNGGVPEYLNISTEDRIVGIIKYGNAYLEARKIISKVGVGYCLEINKRYPEGGIFEVEGRPKDEIANILAAGYPNKSAEELKVASDDDAYFATQIVVWSIVEGYDINKLSTENKAVLSAIKNIYNEAIGNNIISNNDTLNNTTNNTANNVSRYSGTTDNNFITKNNINDNINKLKHTVIEYYQKEATQRVVIYMNNVIDVKPELYNANNNLQENDNSQSDNNNSQENNNLKGK